MKKIVAFLLILALVPAAALSDNYKEWYDKFSPLDGEDLITANLALRDLIFEKYSLSPDGVKVPAGQYIIGEDIPAGTYRIVFDNPGDFDFCTFVAGFEDPSDGEQFASFSLSKSNPEVGKVKLLDGQILYIDFAVRFYTYTSIFN